MVQIYLTGPMKKR